MSVKDAILNTQPTSYWPLDDYGVASCQDEMGLHNASLPAQGVTLAVIPFGAAQAPYFDGTLGSFVTIEDDLRYSQPDANALTVAAWICPLALDNANTVADACVATGTPKLGWRVARHRCPPPVALSCPTSD